MFLRFPLLTEAPLKDDFQFHTCYSLFTRRAWNEFAQEEIHSLGDKTLQHDRIIQNSGFVLVKAIVIGIVMTRSPDSRFYHAFDSILFLSILSRS